MNLLLIDRENRQKLQISIVKDTLSNLRKNFFSLTHVRLRYFKSLNKKNFKFL